MSNDLRNSLRKVVQLTGGDISAEQQMPRGPLDGGPRPSWEDWRCHLPGNVAAEWSSLSEETRLVAYAMAYNITTWTVHP